MTKKIFILTIFFVVLALAPALKVNATQMYVGVQISSAATPGCVAQTANCGFSYASNSGYSADLNWCLPFGSKMAITATSSCAGFQTGNDDPTTTNCASCGCLTPMTGSVNPVITDHPICAGDTIWSGLFNLTNGTNYNAYIYTKSFCPGYLGGSGCYVKDTVNENCCDVCSHYGLTAFNAGSSVCSTSTNCITGYYDNDTNCKIEVNLKGSSCSVCNTGAAYDYYNTTTGACWTAYGGGGTVSACNYKPTESSGPQDLVRVCTCNHPKSDTNNKTISGFLFPFTASW